MYVVNEALSLVVKHEYGLETWDVSRPSLLVCSQNKVVVTPPVAARWRCSAHVAKKRRCYTAVTKCLNRIEESNKWFRSQWQDTLGTGRLRVRQESKRRAWTKINTHLFQYCASFFIIPRNELCVRTRDVKCFKFFLCSKCVWFCFCIMTGLDAINTDIS